MPNTSRLNLRRVFSARRRHVGAAGLLFTAILLTACSNTPKPAAGSAAAFDLQQRQALERAQSLALQAGKTKDPDKAIVLYKQAVESFDQLPAAWNNMGVLMMMRGRRQEADQAFIQAADLAPSDPRPLFNRGLMWFEAKYPNEARTYFRQSLDRDPNYLPALRGSIESDVLTRQTNQETLDLIKRALFVETDKRWRERFELQKSRIENYIEVENDAASRFGRPKPRHASPKGDLVPPPINANPGGN